GEDIGVAMPERIECVDDHRLLVADYAHFLEIDAGRRQIFRDIPDVLVPGAASQDLATDHQKGGRDILIGSGSVGSGHNLLVSANSWSLDCLSDDWDRPFFGAKRTVAAHLASRESLPGGQGG